MENINMNKRELKKFFKKYNEYELNNFEGMFQFVLDYDLDLVKEALEEVKKERYYTSFPKVDKDYKVDQLSDEELEFLFDIAEDADCCLSSIGHMDVEEEKAATNRLLNLISEEKEKRKATKKKYAEINGIYMPKIELISFFSKYSPIELKEFKGMLEFNSCEGNKNIKNILNDVYYDKCEDAYEEFETPVTPTFFSIADLADKNEQLTDKELGFLREITYNYFNELVTERDTDITSYLELVESLIASIKTEEEERSHNKVYTKKDKKKED